jgi:hypothetical protein
MDGAIVAVALQGQDGWSFDGCWIVLDYEGSFETGNNILKEDIIRCEFSKAMPGYADFAPSYKQLHPRQNVTHYRYASNYSAGLAWGDGAAAAAAFFSTSRADQIEPS